MKVRVLVEIMLSNKTLHPGEIIEIPNSLLPKLGGRVKPLHTSDGKDQPHYCSESDSWCSAKLPGTDYPAGCIWHNCEYYHASPDAPQPPNETLEPQELIP